MEAKDTILVDLIGKKENIFYVPLYQRKYTWEAKKEIKRFWEDLLFFKDESKTNDFFFGSIIIKKTNSLNSKHILVDGQQRVTTTLLLIAALVECSNLKRDLNEYITLKNYLESDEDKKFKLERIQDSDTIKKILKGQLGSITKLEEKSKYYKTFNFFCTEIRKLNNKNDDFISSFTNKVLQKIKVATINLNDNEDEYCIFESINSKGKELTTADLIKNFIAMKLNDNDEILKKFENEFVQYFDSYDKPEEKLVDFYRQILAIQTGNLYPKRGTAMYFKFKENFNDFDEEQIKEELIKVVNELIENKIIFDHIFSTKYVFYLYPLRDSNINNFYALVHVIIKHNSKINNNKIEIVNNNNIDWALKYISSLIVGRTLVSFGRVEGNRTYAKLAYDLNQKILETEKFKDAFVDKVINYLEKEDTSNYRMPSKDEIFDINSKRDLYTDLKGNLKSILIAIEESLSKKEIIKSDISVEHIFPQNSNEWLKMCEESGISNKISFENIKEWLNTLGNLSIVDKTDNSRLSNKIFCDKKKILEEKSYLKINKMLFNYNNWGVEEIKDRAKKVLNYIHNIWFND